MMVFFPFEETFYRQAGVPVTWVGHPLVDRAKPALPQAQAIERMGLNPWRKTVGLLPGSRASEVKRHLPIMLQAAERIAGSMPGVQFLIPQAESVDRSLLRPAVDDRACDIRIVQGALCDALGAMDAAIVASGTATLETALCKVPMAVVYKTSWPTYLAAKAVVRIPDIAIVNVVAGKRVVPEFVQRQANPGRIAETVIKLLRDKPSSDAMVAELKQIAAKLGAPGAVERAAEAVLKEAAGRS